MSIGTLGTNLSKIRMEIIIHFIDENAFAKLAAILSGGGGYGGMRNILRLVAVTTVQCYYLNPGTSYTNMDQF